MVRWRRSTTSMLCAQTSGFASTRRVDVVHVAAEIPEERFHEHVGAQLFQPRDRAGDMGRAAVEQVIAIDHRDDDVLETHARERARNVLRLTNVYRAAWIARRHSAKTAAARARVAEQHHGRGALTPTLTDVGATRLFTDGVEIELAERVLQRRVRLTTGCSNFEPRRLWREARLIHDVLATLLPYSGQSLLAREQEDGLPSRLHLRRSLHALTSLESSARRSKLPRRRS